ncbi:hypothetical protein [Frankia sp. CiP3]|uniref:hypothetical protein n=1 Tax=Frankia sp. CiP3 TaxID=2880971 RepID=UPI001EF4AC8D|nr:hypothetical protein [Frankia sp. CiP3]
MALAYPLAHTDPVEPAEALLGDLVVRPGEPTPGLLRRDVGIRALNVAAGHGARVGRIVTGDAHLARALVQVGFVLLDTIIYYEADPG